MKRFAILLAAVTLVVITWSGAWFTAARIIDQSIKLQANASPQITCETLGVAGYPFRFDVTCANMLVVENDVAITLPELKATVLVYRPTHILAFAQGPAQISDAFSGTQNSVSWSSLSASARTNWRKPNRFSITADDVTYQDTLFGDELLISSKHIEAHLIDLKTAAEADKLNLGFYSKIEDATVTALQTDNINVDLDVTITQIPDDILEWANPTLLRSWSNTTGDATIKHLHVTSPDVAATLTGKLNVQPTGLLAGDLLVKSKGLAQQLDTILPPPYGRLIVGEEQPDGSFNQNLEIDAGIVRVGNIPLAQLAPLF